MAPDLADAASPVRFVHPGAPPFLLLHGTADRLAPHRQSAGHQFTGISATLR